MIMALEEQTSTQRITETKRLNIRYLPVSKYRDVLALQHALMKSKSSYLILLEHNHVYTAGVRTKQEHILLSDLSEVGAELIKADRGGDVTYHGPGQLVGYFITDVKLAPNAIPEHVYKLESLVIDVLEEIAVKTHNADKGGLSFIRRDGFPGVWVLTPTGEITKICSVGVRVSKGRSMHGFALNVSPDMSMFSHIVPCGIADYKVTSLNLLGYDCGVDEVAGIFIEKARQLVGEDFEITLQSRPLRSGEKIIDQKAESRAAARLQSAGVELSSAVKISAKKPEWLRAKLSTEKNFFSSYSTVRSNNLVTVCEEAGCPNISECWSDGTATFMINGDRCTRSCGFCLVDTRKPFPTDPTEPDRVAKAVYEMKLEHAVITTVARDDLPDGGAEAFAKTIKAIRDKCPGTTVEVLISDCKGDQKALNTIFDAHPDVLNHNIETVLRLQGAVRPQASYARSLAVLSLAKSAGLITKSSLMIGLGETDDEIMHTLVDLSNIGVSIVTIGQYLRPTSSHLPVYRWYSPEEFQGIKAKADSLGFDHVECSPLTRSSYHAKQAVAHAKDSYIAV
jgi:lipoic acid synthetase